MEHSSEEQDIHWADEAEAIKTNKPLKFVLILFKIMPTFLIHALSIPVAFFFFLSAPTNIFMASLEAVFIFS